GLRVPALLREEALMLILVAVGAQQFPVAPIRRVIVVIVVAVMDFQQLEIGVGEVAPASSAYQRIDLERLFAIALCALFACAPRLGDDAVEPGVVGSSLAVGHDGDDSPTKSREDASLHRGHLPYIARGLFASSLRKI